jgi:two-component system chemotaxis response regulator CheY
MWYKSMRRQRVMIADDSTFMRIMLEASLKRLGFEVVGTVKSGIAAVDRYIELKPDIVLVDASLQGTDGIEVIRRISTENPAAVVIMLIAESEDSSKMIVEAVKAGASGYMKKPLSTEEIGTSLETAMKKSGR